MGNTNAAQKTQATRTQQPAAQASAASKTSNASADIIAEDEKLIIGNCRGMTYAEAKKSDRYPGFIDWVRKANGRYDNEAQQRQFNILKKMVMEKGA